MVVVVSEVVPEVVSGAVLVSVDELVSAGGVGVVLSVVVVVSAADVEDPPSLSPPNTTVELRPQPTSTATDTAAAASSRMPLVTCAGMQWAVRLTLLTPWGFALGNRHHASNPSRKSSWVCRCRFRAGRACARDENRRMFSDVVMAMLAGTVLAAMISQPVAEGSPVELAWEAPTECPGSEAVLGRIEEILGPGQEHAGETVSVSAAIEAAEGGGWRLQLRVDAPGGETERTVRAEQCQTLVDATALVAAIAVDPIRAMAHLQRARSVKPATLVPSAPEPTEPKEPEVEPLPSQPEPESDLELAPEPIVRTTGRTRPRSPVRGGLRLGPGIDYGALPGVAGGVAVGAGVLGRKWRADLVGSYWFPRETGVPTEPRAGGEVSMWAVGARGCWVPGARAFEFPLCAGMEAGVLRGRATRETVGSGLAREPWVAALASASLAWAPRKEVAIVLGVDALVPLRRSGFTIGDEVLYTVAPVGVRGNLGVELRFP